MYHYKYRLRDKDAPDTDIRWNRNFVSYPKFGDMTREVSKHSNYDRDEIVVLMIWQSQQAREQDGQCSGETRSEPMSGTLVRN